LLVSESTRTGFNPNFIIPIIDEIIVKVGIITSSFFLRFKLFKAISNAAVPLETDIPNLLLLKFANFFSNSETNFP